MLDNQMTWYMIVLSALLVNNIVLIRFLALCSFFGVSNRIEVSLSMGMAVTFVLALASAASWIIWYFLLVPLNIEYLRTASFILVIATLVQLVEMYIKKTAPALYNALGIYLPLITTNCAVLGIAILIIDYRLGFLNSIIYSISVAGGYTLSIILFAGLRERIEMAPIPEALKGAPIIFITAGIMSLAFLGFAHLFGLKLDPREEAVINVLPGTNCGACGFPGCAGLARAIIKGDAPANACTSGGADVTKNVSHIMGVEAVIKEKEVAVIMCKGGKREAREKFRYIGVNDCKAATLIAGGNKSCTYACLGLGTCERVCPYGAIRMDDNHLPVVDEEKCTGCTLCAVNCPKFVIKMIPVSNKIHIRCNSLDKGAVTRKNCSVGCIVCKKCEH